MTPLQEKSKVEIMAGGVEMDLDDEDPDLSRAPSDHSIKSNGTMEKASDDEEDGGRKTPAIEEKEELEEQEVE